MPSLIGPIFGDRLKEKIVCLSVCMYTFWPTNQIFGLSDPWDMREECSF